MTPFALNTPGSASPSRIIVTTSVGMGSNVLRVRNRAFSFGRGVSGTLRGTTRGCHPVGNDCIGSVPSSTLTNVFVGMGNRRFLPVVRDGHDLRALLVNVGRTISVSGVVQDMSNSVTVILPALNSTSLGVVVTTGLTRDG